MSKSSTQAQCETNAFCWDAVVQRCHPKACQDDTRACYTVVQHVEADQIEKDFGRLVQTNMFFLFLFFVGCHSLNTV